MIQHPHTLRLVHQVERLLVSTRRVHLEACRGMEARTDESADALIALAAEAADVDRHALRQAGRGHEHYAKFMIVCALVMLAGPSISYRRLARKLNRTPGTIWRITNRTVPNRRVGDVDFAMQYDQAADRLFAALGAQNASDTGQKIPPRTPITTPRALQLRRRQSAPVTVTPVP